MGGVSIATITQVRLIILCVCYRYLLNHLSEHDNSSYLLQNIEILYYLPLAPVVNEYQIYYNDTRVVYDSHQDPGYLTN